jgi:N-acylneuraminate cytidylyltransferase
MGNLCIIPARGGSKRIPRKNIKDFLGKPIIAYSIEAALKSNLFDEVMVSTDDEEIAKVAIQYGAKVPFIRSKKNADDFATTVDVLSEVLNEYKILGESFKNVCCIYPTAPFVTPEVLKEGYNKLITDNFDSIFSVLRFSFPIQRALKIEKGKVVMFYPEFMESRSQDLEPSFHDAGQFYWFKSTLVKEQKKLWTNNTGEIEINELSAQDIDNKADWKLAELKYKFNLNLINKQ